MSRRRRPGDVLALAVIALAACGGLASSRSSSTTAQPSPTVDPSDNVQRGAYAGSRACAVCHAEIANAFERAPMHRMTRDARTADIRAPFEGNVFRFKDDTATLAMENGSRTMSVVSRELGNHKYRVTKVIGGHHREDFAGVELLPGGRTGDEEILPVSWVIDRKAFRYKGYSVMQEERPGLRAGPVWKETCIFCHNTVPYLSTVLAALANEEGGRGHTRGTGYQGATVDRFLPEERRLHYRVGSEAALASALRSEVAFLGAKAEQESVPLLVNEAISATRNRFGEAHLVDLGIGCEACHNGSAAHAANPGVRPTFVPTSSALDVKLPTTPKSPSGERAQWIDRTCARCHQVLFSGYTHTWEGGLRTARGDAAPGGSHINSGEARDFLLGGCASELACTTCHDPHGMGKNAASLAAGFADDAGDATCIGCHARFGAPAARSAHTHHRAGSVGDRCVSCHMPKKNMGLDGRLTRYHRIGSPTDARKVEHDRPLECALCHGDKSVRAITSDMERLWGKRFDRTKLEALYGNLDDNAIKITLARGLPHEQATALAVLGERRDRSAARSVTELLAHRYPLVREYARDALEAMAGNGVRMPVDLHQEKSRVVEQAREWVEAFVK